ncbi:MucR family transcriptional regulator [Methylobacterium sp. NPDC080182]|uniref:MucR family transcriptional regulator n=1 Tax=Methylobacterium sp. NPDC080182 TaxID=3390590 RepID=UPI003CFD5A11
MVDGRIPSKGAGFLDYGRLTSDLVTAYVANNHVPASELSELIATTHAALACLEAASVEPGSGVEKLTPAQIRRSITHEALISFEDGKPYKTLKRHLTACGLTPETYRAKWGLPSDYPMVAPGYSERRSAIARDLRSGWNRPEQPLEAAAS